MPLPGNIHCFGQLRNDDDTCQQKVFFKIDSTTAILVGNEQRAAWLKLKTAMSYTHASQKHSDSAHIRSVCAKDHKLTISKLFSSGTSRQLVSPDSL